MLDAVSFLNPVLTGYTVRTDVILQQSLGGGQRVVAFSAPPRAAAEINLPK